MSGAHTPLSDYADFVSKISFRWVGQNTYVPKHLLSFLRVLDQIGISFEFMNTYIAEEKQHKDRIRRIFRIRKKSTLAIAMIINKIVSDLKEEECFVNIGVWKGFSFFAGMVGNPDKTCIGIDNFSQFGSPKHAFLKNFNKLKSHNHFFYEMDYENYLETIHKRPIGFYIYDGEHSYENQLKNLVISERFFSKNCVVMVDDANFQPVRQATLDFISKRKNDYQLIVDEQTYCNKHMTLWNGILMFQKKAS